LSLSAKIELPAQLSLMGNAGAKVAELQRIYTHPPDRIAAEKFIASFVPAVAVVEVASPLAACKACLEDSAAGALVPQATGETSSLFMIQPDVSDRSDLRVRYGLASSRPASRSGADTTAVVFGVHDEPGALFDVLKHFAERGINLKTIQSRPLQGESWTYAFYVEVSGHVTDRALVTALEEVKRQTRLLKVLGSFPSC
jgi:chorismate mutase/prephenate dehydratase